VKTDVEMQRFAELVARKQGWAVNGDRELLSHILKGLALNHERYGFFLCPCRDSWGDREKDGDIKCPCSYSSGDIKKYQRCYCGLFVRMGSDESEYLEVVPDRRPDELYPE
jgi:ferredoxin-thioredoxin reductase catalytic subunit